MNAAVEASLERILLQYGLAPDRTHVRRPVRKPPRGTDTPDDLPESDADEIDELTALTGLRVGLVYVDARGQESEREVTVHAVQRRAGGDSLYCFCHAREAVRRFRIDRIRSIYDVDTGEAFAAVSAFLAQVDAQSAPRDGLAPAMLHVADAIQLSSPGVHALVFLARCDGWHDSEVSVVCNFILDHPAGRTDIDIGELERQVRRLDPDERTFLSAIRRLTAADGDSRKRLVRAIRRLVDADGVISAAEGRFVDELAGLVV
ncbi:MAG: hypothetical protein GC202_02175 [Alphaproteobacteria bacterium]|nr:hypothetical protein [Alphaproteobacteria bacterium]